MEFSQGLDDGMNGLDMQGKGERRECAKYREKSILNKLGNMYGRVMISRVRESTK